METFWEQGSQIVNVSTIMSFEDRRCKWLPGYFPPSMESFSIINGLIPFFWSVYAAASPAKPPPIITVLFLFFLFLNTYMISGLTVFCQLLVAAF